MMFDLTEFEMQALIEEYAAFMQAARDAAAMLIWCSMRDYQGVPIFETDWRNTRSRRVT